MASSECEVWTADNLTRIFPHTPAPRGAPEEPELALCAARREREAGQIAVRAGDEEIVLRAEASPVRRLSGGPCDDVELEVMFVGTVPVDGCDRPDPLLEVGERTVPPRTTQVLWVRASVGPDAEPAEYTGTIELSTPEGLLGSVPVALSVWDFELPERFSIGLNFWVAPWLLAERFEVELWSDGFFELAAQVAEDLAEHGQDCITVHAICQPDDRSLVRWVRDPVGRIQFDFERFDRWVQTFRQAGVDERMEVFSMYPAHRADRVVQEVWDKRRNEVVPLECEVGSDEYDTLMIPFLRALEQRLEEIDWPGDCLIKIADEPRPDEEEAWTHAARLVRDLKNDFLITDAFGHPQRKLAGLCDVWAVHAWYFDEDFAEERQQAGDEVHVYYSCDCSSPNTFITNTPLEVRLVPWINWLRGLDGLLRWSYCHWATDPWEDPQCGTSYPPGDCYVVYPDVEGRRLAPSIRWELLREGLEDYEYLCLVTDLLDQPGVRDSQEAADLDRQLSGVIDRIVRSNRLTTDPEALQQARVALAEGILTLMEVAEEE